MKHVMTMLTLLLLASASLHAQKGGDTKVSGIETMELDRVVNEINMALGLAEADLKANKVALSSAEVTLQTIRSVEGGGGFKIFVKASKKWQLEKASSITFEYAKDSSLVAAINKGKERLHQALRTAITSAAMQWSGPGASIHGLNKESFTVEISFGVTMSASGGVEFEVWGVGIDLEGSRELTASHTVLLKFTSTGQ